MRKRLFTRWSNDDERLSRLLAPRLQLDAAGVLALVEAGAVWVNGARVAGDVTLAVGDKITVFSGETITPAANEKLAVVHQDESIVVVDKPAGLPSQGERAQSRHALDAAVQALFGAEARLIHRLDKEASGLVLFARRGDACAPLQAALAAGQIDRRYVAVVDGELAGDGEIRLRIGRHAGDQRLRAALPENAPGGEAARSIYRTLAVGRLGERTVTAVELRLDSGRTHQLRVHLGAIGHPIVGDNPYGGPAFARMCLHAHALELPHPRQRRRLRLRAPVPAPLVELVPGLTSALA